MAYKKNKNQNIEKTCFFAGPRVRNFPWQSEDERFIKPLKDLLEKEIRKAIEKGYRHFISGMANGVDMYAARIVVKIKQEQPDLKLIFEAAIPFPSQPAKWTDAQKSEYAELLAMADKKKIIGKVPSVENFDKRNNYMIENAGMLIAVNSIKPGGGTSRLIESAGKRKKEVVVIEPRKLYDIRFYITLKRRDTDGINDEAAIDEFYAFCTAIEKGLAETKLDPFATSYLTWKMSNCYDYFYDYPGSSVQRGVFVDIEISENPLPEYFKERFKNRQRKMPYGGKRPEPLTDDMRYYNIIINDKTYKSCDDVLKEIISVIDN